MKSSDCSDRTARATVRENLLAAADRRDLLAYVTGLVSPGRDPRPESVRTAVAAFGLGDALDRRPVELSYGQRRLVAIARAVATSPSDLCWSSLRADWMRSRAPSWAA